MELLAPAGDLARAKTAIRFGADAVYLGGQHYSLRSRASNFTMDDIREACAFARDHHASIHVTVNEIPHEEDFEGLEDYLIQLQDDATGGWKCTPESDVYTWSTANALSILSNLLYICDNAFCAELRDYVNDVVIQSIYLHADKTSDAKEASDGAQQQNEHIRFGIKPSWIALILKYLLLLAAIWISPKAALLIGILVLIDTIMILIKGDT